MTEREIKEISKSLKDFAKEIKGNPEKARQFLVKAGIVKKDGSLQDPYK